MQYETILLMSILYGIAAYFHRHQGTHLTQIKSRQVTLNPVLVFILWFYNITFLPWLALIYIGYKTIWYYPVIILFLSQFVSFLSISLERKFNWNGALISLTGVVLIPIVLILLIYLSSSLIVV
ncbi:hypothetical protein MCEMHM7_01072 [Candidatus Methylopumilus planktonicus]